MECQDQTIDYKCVVGKPTRQVKLQLPKGLTCGDGEHAIVKNVRCRNRKTNGHKPDIETMTNAKKAYDSVRKEILAKKTIELGELANAIADIGSTASTKMSPKTKLGKFLWLSYLSFSHVSHDA